MNASLKLVPAALALVAATAFVTSELVSQPQEPGGAPKIDPMSMMKEMERLAAPGEIHQNLAAMAGEWNQTYEFRMGPGQPWQKSKGTSSTRSILGGRYLFEEVTSEMMGQPFEGVMVFGYDNFKQEYVGIWMDSMSTRPIVLHGNETDDGSVELTGTIYDPISPEGRTMKEVVSVLDMNTVHMEFYDDIPPAGETKVMQIRYERKTDDR